jgi:hypothetical protein
VAIEAAGFYRDLFKKQRVSPREQGPNLLYTGKLVTNATPSYSAAQRSTIVHTVNCI